MPRSTFWRHQQDPKTRLLIRHKRQRKYPWMTRLVLTNKPLIPMAFRPGQWSNRLTIFQ